MTALVIVQARMSSTRLPGKVLKPLSGIPLVEHVLRRCLAAEVGPVVLATPGTSIHSPLWAIAQSVGAGLSRGSEEDVLDRFAVAAADNPQGGNVIVRVTADDPFVDPNLIRLVAGGISWHGVCALEGYPEGCNLEAFQRSVLYEAAVRAQLPGEREHVTPYMKAHFSVQRILCPTPGLQAIRWTIDTEDDYAYAARVYDRLYPDLQLFGWHDVLALTEQDHAFARRNGR